jgi:predicted AAA+ superfamily ATPase
VGNLRDFERFLRVAALRTGGLLNRADLARDVGISPSTAGIWLSALEAGGLVALLEPWFGNAGKSLVKTPKLHLVDSGLATFLCGITRREDLLASPLRGNLWESAVHADLRATLLQQGEGGNLWFWRDRTREADLLLHRGGRFHLADVTWNAQPDATDGAPLAAIAKHLPPGTVMRRSILGRSANSYPAGDVEVLCPSDHHRWLEYDQPVA